MKFQVSSIFHSKDIARGLTSPPPSFEIFKKILAQVELMYHG